MGSVLYLYAYNEKSNAAKALSRYLLIQRIRHDNSAFKGNANKTVINWGASEIPYEVSKCNILNAPIHVAEVTDKLSFFRKLEETKLTPTFTTDIEKAKEWAKGKNEVVCRTLLRASGGDGIVLAYEPEVVVDAPLYVRYIPKQDEYRVHVFKGEVIDIQKKARRHGCEKPDWQIRNRKNGFIYARDGLSPPSCIREVAIETFNHFSLTFGAVDIIYTVNKSRALALEINTAPGLEGQTVISYAKALMEFM